MSFLTSLAAAKEAWEGVKKARKFYTRWKVIREAGEAERKLEEESEDEQEIDSDN